MNGATTVPYQRWSVLRSSLEKVSLGSSTVVLGDHWSSKCYFGCVTALLSSKLLWPSQGRHIISGKIWLALRPNETVGLFWDASVFYFILFYFSPKPSPALANIVKTFYVVRLVPLCLDAEKQFVFPVLTALHWISLHLGLLVYHQIIDAPRMIQSCGACRGPARGKIKKHSTKPTINCQNEPNFELVEIGNLLAQLEN